MKISIEMNNAQLLMLQEALILARDTTEDKNMKKFLKRLVSTLPYQVFETKQI